MTESEWNDKIIHDAITLLNLIYNERKEVLVPINGVSVESNMNYIYNKLKAFIGDAIIIKSEKYNNYIRHTNGTGKNIKKLEECDKAISEAYNNAKNIQLIYAMSIVNNGSAEGVLKIISDSTIKVKLAYTKLMSYYHISTIITTPGLRNRLTVDAINEYGKRNNESDINDTKIP